jgi:hypothetical protein
MNPETYIKRLKNGKQLRIKFDKAHEDSSGNWWKEELICYDEKLNIFKCYFRESSYDENYCSYYSEGSLKDKLFLEEWNLRIYKDKEFNENDYVGDVLTIDMTLEKNTIPNTSVSPMALFIEKISYFTNEELIELLTMI